MSPAPTPSVSRTRPPGPPRDGWSPRPRRGRGRARPRAAGRRPPRRRSPRARPRPGSRAAGAGAGCRARHCRRPPAVTPGVEGCGEVALRGLGQLVEPAAQPRALDVGLQAVPPGARPSPGPPSPPWRPPSCATRPTTAPMWSGRRRRAGPGVRAGPAWRRRPAGTPRGGRQVVVTPSPPRPPRRASSRTCSRTPLPRPCSSPPALVRVLFRRSQPRPGRPAGTEPEVLRHRGPTCRGARSRA